MRLRDVVGADDRDCEGRVKSRTIPSKKPAIETEWSNEAVVLAIRGERLIDGLEMGAFGVGEQLFTGGPVLRGPWGSVSGGPSDFARYETECKRLNDAFVQGFMRGRFRACQKRGECEARDGEGYCKLCGATVVVDRRAKS